MKPKMWNALWLILVMASLSACGTLTGLPGHGGGKRFAIEQELVSAATRGAVRQMDLSKLRGKKANIFVNAIGDTGAGNIIGGRYSIVSQLRGDYMQTPQTVERAFYPRYTTTTNSSSNSGSTTTSSSTSSNETDITSGDSEQTSRTNNSGTTITESILAAPERTVTSQKGSGMVGQIGVEYKGLGSYHNSEELASDDLQYLAAIMQTSFFLQGVYVVPPSEAEIDVYVTVDVFGTVRSRVDWLLANNEILKAKTILEILAVDHLTGELIISPQSAGAVAEYNEQYVLWIGPVSIKERLEKAEPMLGNFHGTENSTTLHAKNVDIEYPFEMQMNSEVLGSNKLRNN